MRVHWTTTSTFPSLLGAALAWKHGCFNATLATIIVVSSWIAHVAMELWDDLSDYHVFREEMYEGKAHVPETRFSGGSGMLTSAAITPRQIKVMLVVLLGSYAPLAGIVFARAGWPAVAFFAAGVFWSVAYGAPPLRLSARGLGEIGLLMCMGPLIGVGTYVSLSRATGHIGSVPYDVVMVTLVAGILNFAMIHTTEILDIDEDRKSGKRTLVVRFGSTYGAAMQLCSVAACFGIVIALVRDSRAALFALVPLAYGIKEAVWVVRHHASRAAFVERLKQFPHYRVHGMTCLALLFATVLDVGRAGGATATVIWFAVAGLIAAAPGARIYAGRA